VATPVVPHLTLSLPVRMLTGILALALVISGGCRDAPFAPPRDLASPSIHDAAHGGPPGFYFLPPLAKQPVYGGTFDANAQPVVRICRRDGAACGPLVAEFTMQSDAGSEIVRLVAEDEHYVVNWHTDRFDLDPGSTYRVQVLEAGNPLGHVDVQVVGSGRELRSVDTGVAIPLLNGRTLPIKMRIETERGGGTPASVELEYVCGNTFRVRSYGDSEVTLTYEVVGTDERSDFTLPRPERGNDHTDAVFVTQQTGIVGSRRAGGGACKRRPGLRRVRLAGDPGQRIPGRIRGRHTDAR
jgi:hypothetical protein